jgi:hypothetical protein
MINCNPITHLRSANLKGLDNIAKPPWHFLTMGLGGETFSLLISLCFFYDFYLQNFQKNNVFVVGHM